MIVRVFRNLTRRCYSIQAKVNGRWLTRAHASAVWLKDATFSVSEAGRQRVIRTGKKSVHAWVQGELVDFSPVRHTTLPPLAGDTLEPLGVLSWRMHAGSDFPVLYNPRHFATFVTARYQTAIRAASWVRMDGFTGVSASYVTSF